MKEAALKRLTDPAPGPIRKWGVGGSWSPSAGYPTVPNGPNRHPAMTSKHPLGPGALLSRARTYPPASAERVGSPTELAYRHDAGARRLRPRHGQKSGNRTRYAVLKPAWPRLFGRSAPRR